VNVFPQLLEDYFQDTAKTTGTEQRRFRIAGREIALHFCDRGWANEMTAALAHLASTGSDRPDLNVSMWSGAIQPQHHLLRAYLFTLTNWWFDYTGKRGELLDLHGGNIDATFNPDTRILSVVDLVNNRAFYWKQDDSPLRYYETCSPFRSVLHAWMRTRQSFFVHGAAIGDANGGILLVGKGGSGKSTTTLACLRSPLPLQAAGDDYCIISGNSAAGFRANSLYSTAKLVEMRNLEAFPEMSGNVLNPVRQAGEKVALSLAGYAGNKLIDSFPLRALLVPVITGGVETSIELCSSQEALIALAPSTLSQLPSSGATDLRFLGNLARGLPCYRIRLGTDLARIPESIFTFLATLNRAPSRIDSFSSEPSPSEAPFAAAG
jgi:hypothetical protein